MSKPFLFCLIFIERITLFTSPLSKFSSENPVKFFQKPQKSKRSVDKATFQAFIVSQLPKRIPKILKQKREAARAARHTFGKIPSFDHYTIFPPDFWL